MTKTKKHLSYPRNLKIGLFHLGSGMGDVLITGVWNRIMITDLGFRATPVSLLASLRYFLAPLSVWAGQMSDRYAVLGYPRLFWVGIGRTMMALSTFLLGWITAALVGGVNPGLGVWGGVTAAMLLFSLGNAFSGSTFLALVYDRAPEAQRGRAVGIVWTFLLTGFAVGGVLFASLLPPTEGNTGEMALTGGVVRNLFLVAGLVMSGLWTVALVGEERREQPGRRTHAATTEAGQDNLLSLRRDLQTAMTQPTLRMFMGYLALSMAFAFSQDAILEPFAGDVFGMSAETTTRFAAYWGTTAILGSVAFLAVSRRYPALNNTVMSQYGVIAIFVTFVLYTFAAVTRTEMLVMPGLLLLGLGLGMWNIGTLGLMMEMSPDGHAGTFLGFWTLVVTLARGTGISSGGIVRDVAFMVSGSLVASYAVVFVFGALGLAVSYVFLMRMDTAAFREMYQEVDTGQMLGSALD
jgi:MFS transporter, BCD family, chlorophyll transporter